MGYKLSLTPSAKKFVAEKGFDPQFGARPLNRAIQKHIEDPLAEFILAEGPEEGTELKAVLSKDKDSIVIKANSVARSEDIKE